MWRVMVIDDEVRQCKGLKKILLKEFQEDMEVWDFTMAAEALAFLHSQEVDIIITDICMPEMDGLQFMEEAAKENPGIKVILLTGYAEFEYARKALTLGPLIYLNEEKKYTLSLGLQLFQGSYGAQWHLLMAASVLVLTPAVIVFFFGQKHILEGIATTGIKG